VEIDGAAQAGDAIVEADAGEVATGRLRIAVLTMALTDAEIDDTIAMADAGCGDTGRGAGHVTE
jgi:hypothetical protein